ncbi:uncharacterized protein [Phyllobates terribilis]|uniref:uncharacterized protein n=1 Tax=Phyllobates terribilis TaxID=111132 RepID=UPI003CCAB684
MRLNSGNPPQVTPFWKLAPSRILSRGIVNILNPERCTTLNPATLLPLSDLKEESGTVLFKEDPREEVPHDCVQMMAQETAGLPTVFEHELQNADFEFFVDGSRHQDDSGTFHTGYAVVSLNAVIKAEPMLPYQSAQEAELMALTEACKLAEGGIVNIYTDSRYAFGISHDFGPIWKSRGFLTAAGHPIKNADAVQQLIDALQLPKQVAVIKVRAHTRRTDQVSRGNAMADAAAKTAACKPQQGSAVRQLSAPKNPFVSEDILSQMQAQAQKEEVDKWLKEGACLNEANGVWGKGTRRCLPRALYPAAAQILHGPTHQSKTGVMSVMQKHWVAPGFSTCIENLVQGCMICATHNQGRVVKTPPKHTPPAPLSIPETAN